MRADLQSIALGETERKLVGFLVDDVRYGIDIMRVREIVNPSRLVQVPYMPPYVVGVADHREAVVPVVDLRVRFGLEAKGLDHRVKWIISRTDIKEVGVQVDRVTQVLKVNQSQFRERHSLMDAKRTPWIKDVFADDSGLIFELDLEVVLGDLPDFDQALSAEGVTT
jgi:purine-binding chemotaxis protein CheW